LKEARPWRSAFSTFRAGWPWSPGRAGGSASPWPAAAQTYFRGPDGRDAGCADPGGLATTTGLSVQDLMAEATDLLFQQHGLARIARE
jgi:hypothetical protein